MKRGRQLQHLSDRCFSLIWRSFIQTRHTPEVIHPPLLSLLFTGKVRVIFLAYLLLVLIVFEKNNCDKDVIIKLDNVGEIIVIVHMHGCRSAATGARRSSSRGYSVGPHTTLLAVKHSLKTFFVFTTHTEITTLF